ncbi:MAG: ATP-dependent DNA ligase [Planctomycetota bacterium]|nr:ATP-dependent DNA ligase [Planctomycetota bacterium]
MRRFTELYMAVDATTRTTGKVEALVRYFREAPAEDAAWALAYLSGRRQRRAVSTTLLRQWAAEEAELPQWLLNECHQAVGDLSETISLLLPDRDQPSDLPLHRVVEEWIAPLPTLTEEARRETLRTAWSSLNAAERLVFHKLISGSFRVGVQRKLLVRALAEVSGIEPASIAHRLTGEFAPTPDAYRRLLDPEESAADPAQPYPFYLASPLEKPIDTLGDPSEWLAEWKWDGIRAQLIRRDSTTLVWTRGDELVTDAYPELRSLGEALPDGVVIDGEILAWENEAPLPFSLLQRRIGRKQVQAMLFTDVPVVFMAYDLLEHNAADIRVEPIESRRAALADLIAPLQSNHHVRLSPLVEPHDWTALESLRAESRERNVEGLILKRRSSPYQVGRVRGDWWKWKIDPFTVDAVLTHAQPGHGRRASLFTDYTFSVWDDGELVPVAKAYSGLTDDEIKRVDAFVRRNTTARHGPVRAVKPELVFELAFEGIQASQRHRSGVALRFPRMNHWRTDKRIEDADAIESLRALLAAQEQRAT